MLERPVRDLSGGVNQAGLRDYNERLVLSTIQRHGGLPGSEIARRTGLSAQTVSVILRGLEKDGFLKRGAPVRGKVGKPSVPMEIRPDGALSIGLKIGRRSADLVLMDFVGRIRAERQTSYRYPTPATVFGFLREGIEAFTEAMTASQRTRVAGIGIAAPFELWNWHEAVGTSADNMAVWRDISFGDEIARFSPLPVFVENDATAACRAEHVFGRGRELLDYAYFFIGSFAGGGLVLNNNVFAGHTGNAGAFGSLPVTGLNGSRGQLIDTASLYLLEASLEAEGLDPARLWTKPQDWGGIEPQLDRWISDTAAAMAVGVVAVTAVIDVEAVLIDGGFPAEVRERLVAETAAALPSVDSRGIRLPRIEEGQVGGNARAIGAASTPILSQYLLNSPSLQASQDR